MDRIKTINVMLYKMDVLGFDFTETCMGPLAPCGARGIEAVNGANGCDAFAVLAHTSALSDGDKDEQLCFRSSRNFCLYASANEFSRSVILATLVIS